MMHNDYYEGCAPLRELQSAWTPEAAAQAEDVIIWAWQAVFIESFRIR